MSFYSALTLIYPGEPPLVTADQLQKLCALLRDKVGIEQDSKGTLSLKWGERIDADYESTNEVIWHESGVIGVAQDYEWDINTADTDWGTLWSEVLDPGQTIYRAFVDLGALTDRASKVLSARQDDNNRILLDTASLEINPVCPMTLDADELVCTGLIALKFSGYGFFSWQDLTACAAQYQEAPPVVAALDICRELFPVIKNERFAKIDEHLGQIYLNRDYSREGDWILSIAEN